MVWSMSLCAAFVCKAKIGCRLRVKGPFGGGSWYIQRLLCVESHIKVNLAPSALAPPSTNLLSVWWGSWTGSPLQHRGTNPPNLSRFPSSPSPDCIVKVKEVKDVYVHSAPMIAVMTLVWLCTASLSSFLCKMGVLLSEILCFCENNSNVAVPNITAPKWCSSLKRKNSNGAIRC